VKMQAQHLERLGYTVTTITNSQKALEVIQQSPERFDLIITDMTMPKLTGDVNGRLKLSHFGS
jgi:CheY-like chemotaxis protein